MSTLALKRDCDDYVSNNASHQEVSERIFWPVVVESETKVTERHVDLATRIASKYGIEPNVLQACDWSRLWTASQDKWNRDGGNRGMDIENLYCNLYDLRSMGGSVPVIPTHEFLFKSSPELALIHSWISSSLSGMASQAKEKPHNLESDFNRLATIWKKATAGCSITTRRYAHSSYQEILVMGKPIVPLILQELQERPDWWFEALKALTKQDPTKPTDNFRDAVKAWLKWGKEQKPPLLK